MPVSGQTPGRLGDLTFGSYDRGSVLEEALIWEAQGKGLRSQLGPYRTVWPQAGHFTSLNLGFVFVNRRG